ncbi:PLC-like phosphodiesterase [Microthyrium microscopicum]|uniref:PLC-like phosphodiesterase n=1 Tax=Microthyrium microscopicum TaxID=703497 RepID=A0A6A6UG68_9PEZI|nr:PLC-like phosphodiesterase [Microthyrium microscopicum]
MQQLRMAVLQYRPAPVAALTPRFYLSLTLLRFPRLYTNSPVTHRRRRFFSCCAASSHPRSGTTMSSTESILGGPGVEDAPKGETDGPVVPSAQAFPDAPWTRAHTDERHGVRMPQTIAHRGYKAKFPENSMAAFRGAVEVGTHAIETDVHLSKDGVVVLSHDPTISRCFGKPDKIIDLEWSYLKTLRTTAEPHEPLPLLSDLLEYLAEPGNEKLWLLLDIKLDNNADDVMRLIGEVISQVAPAKDRPWNQRITLGVWAANFVPLCDKYLPGFSISHIAFSTNYARQFFPVRNASFNILQNSMMGVIGGAFLRKTQRLGRPLYSWTVNEPKRMEWCIKKQLDGVITDDPRLFLEVCKNWSPSSPKPSFSFKEWYSIMKFQVLTTVYGIYFRWKFGYGVERKYRLT